MFRNWFAGLSLAAMALMAGVGVGQVAPAAKTQVVMLGTGTPYAPQSVAGEVKAAGYAGRVVLANDLDVYSFTLFVYIHVSSVRAAAMSCRCNPQSILPISVGSLLSRYLVAGGLVESSSCRT